MACDAPGVPPVRATGAQPGPRRLCSPSIAAAARPSSASTEKIPWSGELVSGQPRIRLLRSFDQRYHDYRGYVLTLEGTCGEESGRFAVAIGEAAQAKHGFEVGMAVRGRSVPVPDPRLEAAGYYKTAKLEVVSRRDRAPTSPPPYLGPAPDLAIYRARGDRRLDARTYAAKCAACIWGCRMPVEITVDQWDPSKKRYRFETFYYGPKSCSLYRAGPRRTVPGRKGMSYTEEDWVDEEATGHRRPDE